MNPLTIEWINKAEADQRTARREYRARNTPNYDAVCFHAQQAVEKYLKALIQESGNTIPRVHSLAELLAILSINNPEISIIQSETNILEGYAVQFRYPGYSANQEDAKAALKAAQQVCSFIRNRLGL